MYVPIYDYQPNDYKISYSCDDDIGKLSSSMRISPNKHIWRASRYIIIVGTNLTYFYGTRLMEDGTTNSYGSYLSQETGVYTSGTNRTNGVRPIIKLKYTVKLEKTTDLLNNTIWNILS